MAGHANTQRPDAGRRLAWGMCAATGLSVTVIVSAWGNASALGAPRVWPWLLTGLQVLALWAAGRRLWWGWLVGGAVQLPWIAYAAMTDQIGFVPGCLVSASVQVYSFLGTPNPQRPSREPMEAAT